MSSSSFPRVRERRVPAVNPCVRRDSKVDKSYEIQSSVDLENWTVEIDAVPGTGEKITQFFTQTVEKVFYRVEEKR